MAVVNHNMMSVVNLNRHHIRGKPVGIRAKAVGIRENLVGTREKLGDIHEKPVVIQEKLVVIREREHMTNSSNEEILSHLLQLSPSTRTPSR